MSPSCRRTLLLSFVALVLIAAAPAFAAPSAPAPAAAPALAAGATSCGAGFDLIAEIAQPSAAPAVCRATKGDSPAEPLAVIKYRGYCRCSCSSVKNCNTSADCGGSACLGGITCC